MKILSAALACAACLSIVPAAHASKPYPVGYITLSGQHSLEKSELEGILGDFGIESSSTPLLLGGYAGLYLAEGVAFEFGYNSLGEIESNMTSRQFGTQVSESLDVAIFGYQFGVIANSKLGPNAYTDIGMGLGQWYVKTKYRLSAAGLGSESGSSKEKADDYLFFRFGLGYRLTERWRSSFIFQRNYMELGNFDSDFDQLLFTLTYEFGGGRKQPTWREPGRKSLFSYDKPDQTSSSAVPERDNSQSLAPQAETPEVEQPRQTEVSEPPRQTVAPETQREVVVTPSDVPARSDSVEASQSLFPSLETAPTDTGSSGYAPVNSSPARSSAPSGNGPRPTNTDDARCNERNRHLFGILCQ